jgi:soluble lytic murein transglycosylase-like protein
MRRSSLSLALVALFAIAVYGGASFDASSSAVTGPNYTVAAGDTLTSIAARAGVSVSVLAAANHISDPNLILIGQLLNIPDSDLATAAASSQTATSGTTSSTTASAAATTQVRYLTTASLNPTCHAPDTAWYDEVAASQSTDSLPRLLRHRPQRLALRPCFEAWAAHYGIPAALVEGLAWEESGWQNNVVSVDNAYGIGQLTPPTVDFIQLLLGRSLSVAIPDQNIHMTARFIAYLLAQTNGDINQAVAAYYQGLASVRAQGPLPETKQYVSDVVYLSHLFQQ